MAAFSASQVKEQLLAHDEVASEAGDASTQHSREIRHTLLLGAGFFFTFTAWHSAQNLQSSLTMPSGVDGTTALTIVYCLLPIGFALGPAVVRRVGKKRTVLVAMAMYGSFIVANIYPRWWSIYPGNALPSQLHVCLPRWWQQQALFVCPTLE